MEGLMKSKTKSVLGFVGLEDGRIFEIQNQVSIRISRIKGWKD